MKIKAEAHPIRYGNNNVKQMFETKECGIEIEFFDEQTKFRRIITVEQAEDLINRLGKSIELIKDFQSKIAKV